MRHGWNSLEDYLYQYHRRLEDYLGFIKDYTFSAELVFEDGRNIVSIYMEIFCTNKTKITVVKTAAVKLQGNKLLAKTEDYSYNASIPGEGNIFRYDNAHIHNGHKTKHHKHTFQIPGIEDKNSPIPVEDDKWPHLHQIVEELMQYYAHCEAEGRGNPSPSRPQNQLCLLIASIICDTIRRSG